MAAISQQIWDMKYRFKDANGEPVDKTVADSFRRVATALAAPEAEPELWAPRFAAALEDFRFLPAGRILSGAGTKRDVTLFNCFVMGDIPDDMAGIFEKPEGSRPDHAARRRHRLRFLDAEARKGRSGRRRRRRRLGSAVLHGRLGRHVPHHHERRLAARRDDGGDALRPPRHRGFHRGQARKPAGSACLTLSVLITDAFHAPRSRKTRVGI